MVIDNQFLEKILGQVKFLGSKYPKRTIFVF